MLIRINSVTKLCATGITLFNCNRNLFNPLFSLNNYICHAKLHQSERQLAGHSKWANIKHIKAEKDGQRAAMFTRLTRQIRMAIQEGGSSNPTTNTALKNAIEMAVKRNMPMSNIQNTIKKIDSSKAQIKEYLLEAKAFNKVYMVCVLYTDNFAMLKMNVAPILKKVKASYADSRHLFEDMGVIQTNVQDSLRLKSDLEEICTDDAIDVGAEEVEVIDKENGVVNFLCSPIELTKISKNLSEKGYAVESSEHVFVPISTVTIPNQDLKSYELLKEKILAMEGLERIYDNLDPSIER